jgi:hypothetical protein
MFINFKALLMMIMVVVVMVVVLIVVVVMVVVVMVYICIDFCLFPFVYIVMNSMLNGNCGSCSYFTW